MADNSIQPARLDNLDREPVRLLVIGCGNPLAGDDSVGPEIIRLLAARGDREGEFQLMLEGDIGLLEKLQAADAILFVDAVLGGSLPGTLYLVPLPSKDVQLRALGSLSSHGWGLAETLELAQAMGRPLPRLMLLGVEAGVVSMGAPRAAQVERAIALAAERFPRLRSLLLNPESAVWRSTQRFLPDDDSFPG